MKNKHSFSDILERFFKMYLPGELGASSNTIRSYRDTFVLFIDFMDKTKNVKPDKIVFDHFTKSTILDFLRWLEETKGNCTNTRNQRLGAIKSFCKLVMYSCPEQIAQCNEINSIKHKKSIKETVKYLSIEELTTLFSFIDKSSKAGRRDLALLSLLYNTGARVQELIDLTPSNFRMENPATVELHGKGNKKRIVPLDEPIVKLIKGYMIENGLLNSFHADRPLFYNSRGENLTNPGVTYIINKYVVKVRESHPDMFKIKITPHAFRHSRAMHLLQAGVPLLYIRDILGHISIQTTEIYARADSKSKREALEKAYEDLGIKEPEKKTWERNTRLKEMLKSLG